MSNGRVRPRAREPGYGLAYQQNGRFGSWSGALAFRSRVRFSFFGLRRQEWLRHGYWAAWVVGAQKRSKAAVSSSAMLPGSRLSMSRRSSM
jgi:hypothetical protein